MGFFPCCPHPRHPQDTLGALRNHLLSPSPAKDETRQPPSPPPFSADWEPFIHPVAFPGDEYFKTLLFAVLRKIYKMLSIRQSVLLMFSLFCTPGLPGLASWAGAQQPMQDCPFAHPAATEAALGWLSPGRRGPPPHQPQLVWTRWIIPSSHISADLFIRLFACRNEDLCFCKLSNWQCWKVATIRARSHLPRCSEAAFEASHAPMYQPACWEASAAAYACI